MITVKINDLLNSTEALQKLSKTDLKAKLAWQISKLLKAADKEIQEFNESRMKLIQKYGEKDESNELVTDENGNCKIVAGSIEEFSDELNELINSDVEINANKIRINDLDSINFTPVEMNALEIFIDFGEEE